MFEVDIGPVSTPRYLELHLPTHAVINHVRAFDIISRVSLSDIYREPGAALSRGFRDNQISGDRPLK
ncbi:Protein of unknown function [Pyronema omphalodes CBS 100304]|uniref:Uncharacterized protein n=1 Tax=Pyronema omphalodes (strain CBS 100304) TaxID=1076935 RepID=U4LR76_PYROM|nr:Protein of unknown function [Pyronema omphalodes CBS 100304]